ncbi:MAG: hypothetical protein HKUEN01_24760 [Candidatus Kuenenia stuttgartiensis]|nr:MAG: hypothetical protein HKUEN01_24760 [Candidatus Kuenenia stuttgartiensis]
MNFKLKMIVPKPRLGERDRAIFHAEAWELMRGQIFQKTKVLKKLNICARKIFLAGMVIR